MIEIQVPATTANLGPGFDCMGMALNMYTTYTCEKAMETEVIIEGLGAEKLTAENNLVCQSMEKLFDHCGVKGPNYRLRIRNGIDLSRGLGSSASAIVGGLISANYLLGEPLTKDELLAIAATIEGHPDNVAPALFGGLIISNMKDGEVVFRRITPFAGLRLIVFIPEYEVATLDSRKVLPKEVPLNTATSNAANLALLTYGFMTADQALIGQAMDDAIHEPYRKPLIKGFDQFKEKALDHGAFAFSLSGAGSTIIAYGDTTSAPRVKQAFESLGKELGVSARVLILEPSIEGALWKKR